MADPTQNPIPVPSPDSGDSSKLIYSKDGSTFYELDDTQENRDKAEAKGYKQFVDVVHPEKGEFTIPADMDAIKKAQAKGYSIKGVDIPSIPERDSGSATEALALGTLGGASLGAGEFAAKKLTSPEAIDKLKEAHPTAYIAGEVAGSLSSPLSIGRAIVGKLGAVASESAVAGKVAALVEDNAFLKTLYAAGKGAVGLGSSAAIDTAAQGVAEGKPLEQVKKDAITAAKYGAVLGGVVKGALPGDKIAEATSQAAEREVGLTPTKISKVNKRFGSDIAGSLGDVIKEEKLLPGMDPRAAAEKASELKDQVGKQIGGLFENLNQQGAPVDVPQSLDTIKKTLLAPYGDPSKIRDSNIQGTYNKLANEIIPELEQRANSGNWTDFTNMRQYLVDQLKTAGDTLPAAKQAYRQAVSVVDDVAKQNMDKIEQGLGDQYQSYKTKYGQLATIEDSLSKKQNPSIIGSLKQGEPIRAVAKGVVGMPASLLHDQGIYHAEDFVNNNLENLLNKGIRAKKRLDNVNK